MTTTTIKFFLVAVFVTLNIFNCHDDILVHAQLTCAYSQNSCRRCAATTLMPSCLKVPMSALYCPLDRVTKKPAATNLPTCLRITGSQVVGPVPSATVATSLSESAHVSVQSLICSADSSSGGEVTPLPHCMSVSTSQLTGTIPSSIVQGPIPNSQVSGLQTLIDSTVHGAISQISLTSILTCSQVASLIQLPACISVDTSLLTGFIPSSQVTGLSSSLQTVQHMHDCVLFSDDFSQFKTCVQSRWKLVIY